MLDKSHGSLLFYTLLLLHPLSQSLLTPQEPSRASLFQTLREANNCTLEEGVLGQVSRSGPSEWLVTDSTLELLTNDLQPLIDCTQSGDSLRFQLETPWKPPKTMFIPHQLTFINGGNIGSSLTCPDEGPLLQIESQDFTMKGLIVEKCSDASKDGAIVIRSKAFAKFMDMRFEGNKNRVLFVDKKSKVSVQNSTFEDNAKPDSQGGGIYVKNEGELSISDSSFIGNKAKTGGAIDLHSGSKADISTSVFSDNTARLGGTLYLRENSSALVKSCIFSGNSAEKKGGAIDVDEYCSLTLTNTTLTKNEASSGGSVYVETFSNATVKHCTFNGNGATVGGSLCVDKFSDATVEHCTFSKNIPGRIGGAIRISENSSLVLTETSFSEHKTEVGGSVSIADGSHGLVTECNFTNNEATRKAGVICIESYSSFTLQRSFLSSNKAELGGSLRIESSSNATVEDCTFTESSAIKKGGAIFIEEQSLLNLLNTTLTTNKAEHGGSLYMSEYSLAIIQNSTFTNHTATKRGGVIHVDTHSTLNLISSVLTMNRVDERGGSVFLEKSSDALITQSTFINNTASKRGGAIAVEEHSSLKLHKTTLSKNIAPLGGCVYLDDFSFAQISDSCLINNSAVIHGGGLYMKLSNATLEDSTFLSNDARENGGGLYMELSNATLENSTFLSNDAGENGGGIYAVEASQIQAEDARFMSNLARLRGGGISSTNASSILCQSCRISKNRAFSGAGMYVQSNGSLTIVVQIQDSRFESNIAQSHGGGVELDELLDEGVVNDDLGVAHGYLVSLNTAFVNNHATFTGAAILTTVPGKVLVSCGTQDSVRSGFLKETALIQLSAVHPSKLCPNWKNNTIAIKVYEGVIGTYGNQISVALEFDEEVKLVGTNETGLVLENVSSGRKLPVIYITILDSYGMGPAPTSPYSFKAEITSTTDFLHGTYSAMISAGTGNFTKIIGFASPGEYLLEVLPTVRGIKGVNLTVVVRGCHVGEEPTQDNLRCQACDSSQYNFDVSKVGGCQQCPEHANCSGSFIVPKQGYWNKSPCHETLTQCIAEKACRFRDRRKSLLNIVRDETTCEMSNTTLENYSQAQCHEGYQGRLCGSCKKSYGLSSSFECQKCRHVALSIMVLLGSVAYLFAGILGTILGVVTHQRDELRTRQSNTPLLEYPSSPQDQATSNTPLLEYPSTPQDQATSNTPLLEYPSTAQDQATSSNAPNRQAEGIEIARTRVVQTFKILVNFLQVASTARGMEVNWTDDTMETLEGMQTAGAATINAVTPPIDCLISTDSHLTRSVLRVVFSLLVPCSVILMFALYWGFLAIYKYPNDRSYFPRRLLLTVVSVVYTVYFDLTQLAVKVFNCVSIPDDEDPFTRSKNWYWIANTSIKCYDSKAHVFLMAIALGVLLTVTLSFPFFCAWSLFNHRRDVTATTTWAHDTMGFLCGPFKRKFVYWECVIMIKKALLSIIIVYSYSLGTQPQGLLTILVLIFFLYIHLVSYPFADEYYSLNYYEAGSLMVSGVIYTLIQFLNVENSTESTRGIVSISLISIGAVYVFVMVYTILRGLIRLLKKILVSRRIIVSDDMSWFEIIKLYYYTRNVGGDNP